MSRQNLEDNQTRRQRHNSPSYGTVKLRLNGTYTILSEGPTVHFLDPGGNDRTVVLPAIRSNGGQLYYIVNDGSANVLNIVDSLGVAVASAQVGTTITLLSSPTEWASAIQFANPAPGTADYIVRTANPTLTAELVATDSASVSWDFSTLGAAKLTRAALSGDVSAPAGSNSTTIGSHAVTAPKFRQSTAISIVGNGSNAIADVVDIVGTANQIPIINSAGNALAFTTVSGDLTNATGVFTIANGVVSYAKIQNVAASRLLGNPTGGATSTSEISLGTTLIFSGSALQTAAHTGDVTTPANSFVTTIANNAVTNAKAAQMAAHTVKGNNTAGTANSLDLTIPQLVAQFTLPTVQTFTSGSGTYTTPANVTWIEVVLVGGGGGGAAGGTTPGAATAGAASTFGSSFLTANGGGLGRVDGGVAVGGTATGGDLNFTGQDGPALFQSGANNCGSPGGNTPFSGSGPVSGAGQPGNAAKANTGSGGGGGGSGSSTFPGGGGAAGGYCKKIVGSPNATYAYTVGAGGSAGTAGTNGQNGGGGAAGIIQVIEHYN